MLSLATTVPVRAQESKEPDAKARIHFGPLALNPTIAVVNVGVDSNVFYEADPLNPKSDFTMTLQPGTDLWLRVGRSWFSANIKEELVYYQAYASQRSANNFDRFDFMLPFNRLTLKAGGKYANTNDRPGYEISQRIHHVDTGANAVAEFKLFSKTFLQAHGEQTKYSYDQNVEFFGTNIRNALNRTATVGALAVRHQLTPLTALTFDGALEQDRFEIDHTRDSDSTQLSAGVQFDPFALIKGSAKVGYRDFRGLDPTLPSFKGTTAAVDLWYVALGSTRIGVQGTRDVEYSFDANKPYFIQSTIGGSITQHIYGSFDVVARAGAARLAYQDRAGITLAYPNEVDYVHTYGGGAGYRLGTGVRIGVDVNAQRRTSPNPFWNYHALVIGMSVTYGY